MTTKLFLQTLIKFFSGLILVGLLIFLPAGTVSFFNGWIFILVLFAPMLILGIVLMIKAPKLLEKRLNTKEKQKEQKTVVALSAAVFIVGFVVAGLNFCYGWYSLPKWAVFVSTFVFLIGYVLYSVVLYENKYLSRTVEVTEEQKVVDSGLYGIVRHPMYFATVIMFLAMPLVLGSVYSFLVFLAYPFIIAKRIKSEEAYLAKNLFGYADYTKRVKYRLIPFVW